MRKRFLEALAVALALCSAAHAAPITFSFEGVVDNDPFGVFNDPLGSPATISGTYTFDSAIPQVLSTPDSGGYADTGASVDMTASFANTLVPSVSGPYVADELNITVNNDFPGPLDQYLVTGQSTLNAFLSIELILEDTTGTAFSNTSLPLTPPSLAAFTSARFAVLDGTQDIEAEGFLTLLQCTAGCARTVPEPTTPLLLGAALLVLGIGSRLDVAVRRRR